MSEYTLLLEMPLSYLILAIIFLIIIFMYDVYIIICKINRRGKQDGTTGNK